jgi:hypothetical protein
MQEHLAHVIETLLQSTGTEARERVKTEIAARRQRYRRPTP